MTHPPSFAVRIAIFLTGMIAFLQVYSVQAILPVIKAEFNTNAKEAGLIVGMTVMAIACVSPFMGVVSDRIGRRGLIIFAMAFLALPTFLLGISQTLFELKLWRFLQGLCVPAMTVVILAYLSEEFPKFASKLTAIYVAGTVLGGFLGRFVLGYLHDLIGYQQGFMVMSAFTLLGAWLIFVLLPKSQAFIPTDNFGTILSILHNHRKNPTVIAACTLGGCVLFSLVGCFTFINLYLGGAPYHLSTKSLANLFLVYLIGVVITPFSAQLITKIGTKTSLIISILISAFGLILTLLVPLPVIILGLAIMSSGVFITQSATISYMTTHISQGRSLGLGLYYMMYYFGGSLGAYLCGVAWELNFFGRWEQVVALILLVQLLGLGIVMGIKKNSPSRTVLMLKSG